MTQNGHGLFHVIVGVRQWGEEHFYAKGETHSKRIDRKNKDRFVNWDCEQTMEDWLVHPAP